MYGKLREHGESKEKSARIANAAARSSRRTVEARGGKSPSYQDWSKDDLIKRAPGDRHQGAFHHEQGSADRHLAQPLKVSGPSRSDRRSPSWLMPGGPLRPGRPRIFTWRHLAPEHRR
jgi:hypothetical protein